MVANTNTIAIRVLRTKGTSFLGSFRRGRPIGFADDAPVEDYELIDAGDEARLERFGQLVVARPAPGAWTPAASPERWDDADLRFDRESGWHGAGLGRARDGWTARIRELELELRPTDSGQVGLFPEHASMLPWLEERIRGRDRPAVLHLFASTGLLTLGMARAGAAVAHVDASRPSIAWARSNAARNDMVDAPIRWLVDDARAFTAREVRRGRRYDGVVLDPPTYGHGSSGQAWRLERDLPALLDDVDRVLAPDGFLLLTAHTGTLDPFLLGGFLGRGVEVGELALDALSGARLHLGAFARLDRGA
jgi:23S rRNA (cytosine1962-C5)-methyltransferase